MRSCWHHIMLTTKWTCRSTCKLQSKNTREVPTDGSRPKFRQILALQGSSGDFCDVVCRHCSC